MVVLLAARVRIRTGGLCVGAVDGDGRGVKVAVGLGEGLDRGEGDGIAVGEGDGLTVADGVGLGVGNWIFVLRLVFTFVLALVFVLVLAEPKSNAEANAGNAAQKTNDTTTANANLAPIRKPNGVNNNRCNESGSILLRNNTKGGG